MGAHTVVRAKIQIFRHGGKVSIGAWSYVGEGSRIWSASSIEIGDHVLISHNVDIHDTDGHPLDATQRRQQHVSMLQKGYASEEPNVRSAPVKINDDAWIGFGSAILPGVEIGQGAIVAAHSVVTKDVLPLTLVAGNPARLVRSFVGRDDV